MRRLKGAATASRMHLRRGDESSGRGTDDVERPVVIGSASTVQSRVERSRTVMAPAGSAAGHVVALALTTSRRWRWPERVPWPAAPIAFSGPGGPPSDVRFQELRARKDSPLLIKGAGWGCEPCMAGGGASRRRLIKF